MDNKSSLPEHSAPETSDIRKPLQACRTSFLSVGFFSLFINLLLLVPSLYMLQVYDRVLASNSESTLLMLTLITVFLFVVMGGAGMDTLTDSYRD